MKITSRSSLVFLLIILAITAATTLVACTSTSSTAASLAATGSAPTGSGATEVQTAATTQTATPDQAATQTTGATDGTAATTAGGTTDVASSFQATDTSYISATKTISISTMSTGSSNNKVTYYVADIQLTDPLDLESAFSNGAFGSKSQDTSAIAEANNAIVAINGDFYSSRDDGIVIRDGVIYRDVPTRQGLAIYKDGTMEVYDETATTAEKLLAEGVWNTYSFGPGLLVDGSIATGLDSYEADANARHPIQGTNPRTGVGIIDTNHFVFVVVDGRSPGYSRGVTLTELAQIFQQLGCSTAYNLDGGGSSTLYFMGSVVNDPAQKNGERAISDILFIN
jgi:exopolysaccharide biosynthesis protein